MEMTKKQELKDRVDARRAELKARISELKADGRAWAIDEKKNLEKTLSEIEAAVSKGWNDMSEAVATKLNKLLN